MTQNKRYKEQHKNFTSVQSMPHLCGFYPDICLATEEKAQKTSIRVAEECQLAR